MTAGLAYGDEGSGPPLVLVHGIACNRHHWGPVVERLRDRFRCISVDLLGHGESARDAPAGLEDQVGALVGLLGELGLESPVLVGHSFGAAIAAFAATAAPVRGVVNVDQAFDVPAFQEQLRGHETALRGSTEEFTAAFDEVFAALRPDLVPPERQRLYADNTSPEQDVVLQVWALVLDTPPEELRELVQQTLPVLTAPYLAIFGAPISDEERRLQGLVPAGRVEVWDGLGHFIPLVDPERTARRIAAFADELATG